MSSFREMRDLFINILLCFYLIQIVGIADISWIKRDSSYFGLWTYCDKSAEYDCCQGSHTIGLKSKAWLEASRVFIMFGAIGGCAVIVTMHFFDKHSSTAFVIIMGIQNFATAVCIFIGTGVFHDWYRKEVLLHQYQPHACIALSFINGFVYVILGTGFLIYALKGSSGPVVPYNAPQNVPDGARRTRGKPDCPRYWQTYRMRKYVKHFDLYDVDDKTLSAIKNLLQDTWKTVGRGRDGRNLNHNGINVTKVERVENVNLFIKYNTNRRHMLKSQRPFRKLEDIPSSSGQILTMTKIDHLMLSDIDINRNECYLFHGTKNTFHENIMSKGLDPRLSSGGAMFGTGVYTAESPSKADHYTDSIHDRRSTNLKMFLVRVLLGNMYVTKTAKQFKKPPCMDCGEPVCALPNHEPYDSVVADCSNLRFREFILYDALQCYPEYLITYDRE